MKKAQYLSIMTTIVLVMVLMGMSFAWYSSNTSVSANNAVITAAEANQSQLSFVYSTEDVSNQNLYISEVNILTDEYGRNKYTGETGVKQTAGADTEDTNDDTYEVISAYAATAPDYDYAYTAYYLVHFANAGSAEIKITNIAIKNCTIYRLKDKDTKAAWNTFRIGSTTYTIDGTNVKNENTDAGTYTTTVPTDTGITQGTDGMATIGGTNYYFIFGRVYTLNGTELQKAGYYGWEDKATKETVAGNFTITTYSSYTITAGKLSAKTVGEPTITAGDTNTPVLIGIQYASVDGGEKITTPFDYSGEEYMGAYFTFEIEVTTNEAS